MARIRTIKPEFWTSEQVMECSTNARLLFIGLWNFCDDAGRMTASAKRIKASVFPSDDFTADDVRRMLDELSSNGLLLLYLVDGKEYLQVTGWHHQKIDRAQTSKLPDPADSNSTNDRRTIDVGMEGNGREWKGKESTPAAVEPEPARAASNGAAAAEQGLGPGAKPETPRERFLRLEARCRQALPNEDWGHDPQFGPMADLEAQGLDLEREIVPALLDLSSGKKDPIRTWRLLADKVAKWTKEQRERRLAQGLSAVPATATASEPRIDFGNGTIWPRSSVERVVAIWSDDRSRWPESTLGPPPGQPGCRVPAELLPGGLH